MNRKENLSLRFHFCLLVPFNDLRKVIKSGRILDIYMRVFLAIRNFFPLSISDSFL